MVEGVSQTFKDHPDSACRNLIEVLLQCMELREAARQVYELDVWNVDKEETLELGNSKNLRLKDILYFKDKEFKRKTLKFFEKLFSSCCPENPMEIHFLEGFLEYLTFFTECKLREFRNLATQIGLAIYTGMMANIAQSVEDSKKDSKVKVKPMVSSLLKIVSNKYYEELLKRRISDVDTDICKFVIEHLLESYLDRTVFAVDECAFLLTHKQSDRSISELEIFKNGPLSKLFLDMILASMQKENLIDRIARFLKGVPVVLKKVQQSSEDSSVSKWHSKSKSIIDANLASLKSCTSIFLKAMVEGKDEVGSNIIKYFASSTSFADLLTAADERCVLYMMISVKQKTKDACIEYVTQKVLSIPDTSQEERVELLARMLSGIDRFRHEQTSGNGGQTFVFDEKRTLNILSNFIPGILEWFCVSIVTNMFLNEDQDVLASGSETSIKEYVGCILMVMLQAVQLITEDKIPSSKMSDNLKGEFLEAVKGVAVASKTSIRESVKKSLLLRHTGNNETFRVHLKLISQCCNDNDQGFLDVMLDLFNRTEDSSALKQITELFRRKVHSGADASFMNTNVFIELLQKTYDDHFVVLQGLLDKWKHAKKNEEPHLVDLACERVQEEMLPTFKKVSTLGKALSTELKLNDSAKETVCFILDISVADKFNDREIVESCLHLVQAQLNYYLSNMGSQAEQYFQWRENASEYFTYFLDKRSNPTMQPIDALLVRRLVYSYYASYLMVASHDRVAVIQPSLYKKPDDSVMKLIWDFLEDYLFTTDSTKVEDLQKEYRLMTEEKPRAGNAFDVERQPGDDSAAKDEEKKNHIEQVYLRARDYSFVEDAASVVEAAFKLCLCLFRSIGSTLAQRLIYKLLKLDSVYQNVLISKADILLSGLIKQQSEDRTNTRLPFWKFVYSCIGYYDLPVLKKLSKQIFRVYSKEGYDEKEDRIKYENFCLLTINWAADQQDLDDVQKVMPFLKKSLFAEERFIRLLYYTQHMLEKHKETFKERETEYFEDKKTKQITAVRDQLALLCNRATKTGEGEKQGASRRVSKGVKRSSTGNKNDKVDEEERGRQTSSSKKAGGKAKGNKSKSKGRKQTKMMPEDEPEQRSRTKSIPKSRRSGSASQSRSKRSESSQSLEEVEKPQRTRNQKGGAKSKPKLTKEKRNSSLSPEKTSEPKKVAKKKGKTKGKSKTRK